MNKFTSEDLMNAMKLQVGDRIKVNFTSNMFQEDLIYEVVDDKIFVNQIHLKAVNTNDFIMIDLNYLVNIDFEILPKPKRVGDLKCGKISENKECSKCPLRSICATLSTGRKTTLYEMLEIYKLDKGSYLDQEIYDLLKARLDREVKEIDDKM